MENKMSWKNAENKVKEIAKNLPIYWGTGSPIEEPHVVAYKKDALSGEGQGFNVVVYPEGNDGLIGLGIPCSSSFRHSVSI